MEVIDTQSQAAKLAAGGDIADKFNIAKGKKEAGDEAFKKNDLPTGASPHHAFALQAAERDARLSVQALS